MLPFRRRIASDSLAANQNALIALEILFISCGFRETEKFEYLNLILL